MIATDRDMKVDLERIIDKFVDAHKKQSDSVKIRNYLFLLSSENFVYI